MHLKETITAIINLQRKMAKEGGKIDTCINAILKSKGIVIVTGFSDSSHYMAHNRESALIDFIGLPNLTNIYNGSRFGDFTDFSCIKSKNYGMLALYVLFKNYVYNGATAFTFEDLCFQKTDRSSDINGNNCEHKCLRCSNTMNC